MAIFTTATKTEVVNGTAEQIEDLVLDMIDADRTDLIATLEAMGITFDIGPTGELVLCSCRRKEPTA